MLMVTMPTGIVIFAHGSSVASANDAVRAVAVAAAQAGDLPLVEVAFLEARPTLAEAVAALSSRGAAHILVIPYFLTLGIHLQRDLPGMVAGLVRTHPGIAIRVTPPLDGHPALVRILLDRAHEALATSAHECV
jgi:sirohydrochlorin ferrochelatase